jgi:C4-dicarboxylate transporter
MQTTQISPWLLSLPSLLIISILGMFIHFLKKNIKGETVTEIKQYFSDNLKSTFIALVATVVGTLAFYFGARTGTGVDIISAFGCGYTFDSLFNKWDK